jgi:hypothetical protein
MISAYDIRFLSNTLPMPLYTLDIWTTHSLIISELLHCCTFIQANSLLHGLFLCLGSLFTRMCSSIQKSNPDNPAIPRLETQKEDEKPYSPCPRRRHFFTAWETPSNQVPSSPSSIETQARLPPLPKSTSPHGIKRLRVKGNPPHIQNKYEGGYGTLKRRDYLQPSHRVRTDYAVAQFV